MVVHSRNFKGVNMAYEVNSPKIQVTIFLDDSVG